MPNSKTNKKPGALTSEFPKVTFEYPVVEVIIKARYIIRNDGDAQMVKHEAEAAVEGLAEGAHMPSCDKHSMQYRLHPAVKETANGD